MALLELLFPSVISNVRQIKRSVYRQEIMMSAITETLLAVNDQLNKASKEIVEKITELESRDYLSDEDTQILASIKAGAQTLDDIVPDKVVDEAQDSQDAEANETEAPSEDESE